MPEILVTVGMFAIEVLGYILITRFPCCPAKTQRTTHNNTGDTACPNESRSIPSPASKAICALTSMSMAARSKAWSSGQMWRGVELILLGRDPRDAWAITQRICGVCTTVHAITSVRAVENALQMEVPLNAQYIRNLIMLAHSVHDFIVHFYHLSALDWVDVTSALKADPDKTASIAEGLSSWH